MTARTPSPSPDERGTARLPESSSKAKAALHYLTVWVRASDRIADNSKLSDAIKVMIAEVARLSAERERMEGELVELELEKSSAVIRLGLLRKDHEAMEADLSSLEQRVAAIADDFHPDHDRDAPAALAEMRDALAALGAQK